jgi:hypothetical protein
LTPAPGETILEVLRRKEFVVPSSPRASVEPDFRPPAQRERARHYQLDAIAYMSVSGTSLGEMTATTGLSETYITRLLSDKRNKTFNKLRDEYKRKKFENVVGRI